MESVVLFIDSLLSGGAQRQIATLARELAKRNYEVTILVYYDFDHYESYVKEYNVRIVKVLKKNKFDLSFYYRIYQYFKSNKDSVYIAYMNTPSAILRVLGGLAQVKKIITSERNIDLVHSKSRVFLERLLYKKSDHIVVNAYAIKDMMVGLSIPADKITCIYNGVDTAYFEKRSNGDCVLFRESFGVKESEKLILLPGRIMKQKNHMSLLKAVNEIVARHNDFKLIFVGNELDLEIKQQLVSYSSDNNFFEKIIFAGFQDDMPLVYSSSDLVVLPSLWEGLPNGVIESMACSKVVIASDVSDNAKIIKSGVNGFVTKVDDEFDLAEKLDAALSLNDVEVSEIELAARKTIVELCSLEKFSASYEALIKD